MKRLISMICVVIMVMPLYGKPMEVRAANHLDIAAHWAPRIYQDVNSTYSYEADYITNFNYDGNWNGKDNWENLYSYPLKAYVYYWVQETSSHYFIGYAIFHPRDDGPLPMDKHENDMEGILLAVKKDGSTYGSLQVMETAAHNEWYQYTNDSNIYSGLDNIDGSILMDGSHPKVFIQANGQSPMGGHGIHAYDGSGAPGGDGIVYYYGGSADTPTSGSGNYSKQYSYDLKSIDELWNRRYQYGDTNTFASFGALRGDNYTDNAAKCPWGWDDNSDGATFIGECFSDPAAMIDTHLNGLGTFSHNYVDNRYYTYKFQVTSVTSMQDRDPFGGKSDVYVKFMVGDEKFTDDRLWKRNNASKGTSYQVYWGKDQATSGNQYSGWVNHKYVVMPKNSSLKIMVMDSDDGGDDEMGYVSTYLSAGQTKQWTNAYTSSGQAKLTASIKANTDY